MPPSLGASWEHRGSPSSVPAYQEVVLAGHPALPSVIKSIIPVWLVALDAGVQQRNFSNHCRAAATQYYLDGILVTGETEQYFQLGNYIKPNVHLCVKNEKNPQVFAGDCK